MSHTGQVQVGADLESRRIKILIVGEEPSARDAIRILLGSTGCECTVVSNMQQALAAIEQKNFDAVVVDPRSSNLPAAALISTINEFHPNLLDRILVITDESSDSVIGDLIERYTLPHVQRKLLLQQLRDSVESLLHPAAAFRHLAHVPRLIFDSFRDPLPAGMRASQGVDRRLLYAFGSLKVDLWIEPQAGSNRIGFTGQILDSARPGRRIDSASVGLLGWKGPLAHATTNEFGEFHLDFDAEPSVRLQIKSNQTDEITIPLPRMEWAMRRAAGYS